MMFESGLPHMDWDMAGHWLDRQDLHGARRESRLRGIAAAWLDELCEKLAADHERWRSARVEGIGPTGAIANDLARFCEKAIRDIETALVKLRGPQPLPPIAIIAVASQASYYSVKAVTSPEGEWAASGGAYINQGAGSFPMLVFPATAMHAVSDVIAHELAHHALHAMDLPLGIEEGIAQMMEERVTGRANFTFGEEMRERHRNYWLDGRIEQFVSGESFSSPTGEDQELSYHLAQVVVRGLLSNMPERFFEFAKACRELGPEEAAQQHLGASLEDVVLAPLR